MNRHFRPAWKSKITSKGQTTVPKEVRDALNAKEGTQLEWRIDGSTVTIRAKTLNIADYYGFLAPASNGRHATIEEMNESIGQAVADKFRRNTR